MDYLSRKQTNIDSLVLVTDGSCAYNYDKSSGIDLSAFLCLRKLSWRASPSEHDMRALEVALKQVSHQLVELELDFVNKTEAQQNLHLDDDELDSFFTQHILGLPTASMARVFPAVQVLSLADISFKSVAQDWAHAFDFGLLRSLKLRFCDGWEDFLLHGIGLSRPTRLKSLEIQSTLANAIDAETSISEFLGSFQGLEQLIISNGSPSRTLEIWRAMVHHKSTLRVLVHHQRGVVLDEDSDYFEEECDDPSLSLELDGEEMFEWSKDDSQHPLSGFGLEFIGLCCHPGLLMTGVLGPLSTNRSLRILHIRQSGTDLKHFGWSLGIQNVYADTDSESDSPATGRSAQTESGDRNRALNVTKPLRDLAQWAFGPNGMPSLQVIAYGDFSYEGRYARSQVLLVRNARQGEAKHGVEGPFFRYIAPGDRWQKNLVHDYYDILAACPASRLLE